MAKHTHDPLTDSKPSKKLVAPVRVAPSDAPADAPVEESAQIILTHPERLELLYLSLQVEKAALRVGAIQKDAAADELQLKVAQEQLQRMQAEFANRNLVKAQEIVHLQRERDQAVKKFLAFRADLGAKYQFEPEYASFDEDTGLVHLHTPTEPVPSDAPPT